MSRRSLSRRRKRVSRQALFQSLESRHLMAAGPLGATWTDTSEYLLGDIGVTTVLIESNGGTDTQTQNWSPTEIQATIDKVIEGVTWWSDLLDTLGTVHELDFVFDNTFAVTPFESAFEPIDRPSTDHNLFVSEFVTAQGHGNEVSIENAIWRFNDAQRERMGTDWAFTVFIVDSSDDDDGFFAPGGFPAAFALPGGLYMVVPSERSASTIAHEMGHIFWAFDEYSGGENFNARRGYGDFQNTNAFEGNPNPELQEDSIMRGGLPLRNAFLNHTSPEATLALVGWYDSDDDGIFDILDVPLNLDVVGVFDDSTNEYRLTGTAGAVPLFNKNSYGESAAVTGTNSDITLNHVDEIQYRLDGGPWLTAAQPGQQIVDVDLTITINQPFNTISWRALDSTVGVTSPVFSGTPTVPLVTSSSHTGYAFLDQNTNGTRQQDDPLLAGASIQVRRADSSPILGGTVRAADFSGQLPSLDGITLSAIPDPLEFNLTVDETLHAGVESSVGGRAVFLAQVLIDDGFGGTTEGPLIHPWSNHKFQAEFDEPVGEVAVEVVSLADENHSRIEAYDAGGNLIARTTKELADGQVATLTVSDPRGSIASVRVFGIDHTRSSVAITEINYGTALSATTDATGTWSLPNLADGQYVAQLTPQLIIHQFDQDEVSFEVVDGVSDFVGAPARRIVSPRHNETLAEDTDQNESVSARDALLVINELARGGARALLSHETAGFKVDVNDDGSVTALDALLVINALGRIEGEQIGDNSQVADQALVEFVDETDNTGPSVGWHGSLEASETTLGQEDRRAVGSGKTWDNGDSNAENVTEGSISEPNIGSDSPVDTAEDPDLTTDPTLPEISEPLEGSAV